METSTTATTSALQPAPMTLEYWAELKPEAVAIIEDDRSMTWDEWNSRANRFAGALQARGLSAGDIVVVRTHIRLEWSVISAALAKLECRLLGMNWRLTPAEARYVLNNSQSAAIICDDADPAALLPAFEDQPLKAKISIDVAAPGYETYDELLAQGDGKTFFSAGEPSIVLYTSGTTGLPKGVMRERATDPVTLEYLADVRDKRASGLDDVYLVTMPMHHGSGPGQMWSALRTGSSAVIMRKFDPLAALNAIEQHQVTQWTGVPTMFKRIAALPRERIAAHSRSSIKQVTVGAAPVSDGLKHWIIEHFGDCLSEGYGSTETGMVTFMPAEMQKLKPGSSGYPYKHVHIEIRDEASRVLSIGETGAIWVWTPVNIHSYLRQPKLETDTLDERGFFCIGDIGRLDEDGYLYISDRAKDMIISGGVNIYPAEIEAALQTHSAVADAAVIGIPDDDFGESVMGFCELRLGCQADEAELLRHCSQVLASYKRPRALEIVDELPRNTVGKLLKRELRKPYWEDKEKQI